MYTIDEDKIMRSNLQTIPEDKQEKPLPPAMLKQGSTFITEKGVRWYRVVRYVVTVEETAHCGHTTQHRKIFYMPEQAIIFADSSRKLRKSCFVEEIEGWAREEEWTV